MDLNSSNNVAPISWQTHGYANLNEESIAPSSPHLVQIHSVDPDEIIQRRLSLLKFGSLEKIASIQEVLDNLPVETHSLSRDNSPLQQRAREIPIPSGLTEAVNEKAIPTSTRSIEHSKQALSPSENNTVSTRESVYYFLVPDNFYTEAATIVKKGSESFAYRYGTPAEKKLHDTIVERDNHALKRIAGMSSKAISDGAWPKMPLSDYASNYLRGLHFQVNLNSEVDNKKLVHQIYRTAQTAIATEQNNIGSKEGIPCPKTLYTDAKKEMLTQIKKEESGATGTPHKKLDKALHSPETTVSKFFWHYQSQVRSKCIDAEKNLDHAEKKWALLPSTAEKNERKIQQAEVELRRWFRLNRVINEVKEQSEIIYNEKNIPLDRLILVTANERDPHRLHITEGWTKINALPSPTHTKSPPLASAVDTRAEEKGTREKSSPSVEQQRISMIQTAQTPELEVLAEHPLSRLEEEIKRKEDELALIQLKIKESTLKKEILIAKETAKEQAYIEAERVKAQALQERELAEQARTQVCAQERALAESHEKMQTLPPMQSNAHHLKQLSER
ncbi:MAG: hypothetical protein IT497_06280 [Ottowia sp.]|nr:hypothetical protein [Ottowia sp.]